MEYKIGQTFVNLTRDEIKDIAEFCNSNGNCHLFCMDNKHYEIRANEPIPESVILEEEKMELEAWLSAHDYIGTKIATGRATVEEYADIIAEMNEKAKRINEIDEILARIETSPID